MDSFQLDIRTALFSLSDKGRLLFAAITCVHLYPNYENFVRAFGWGNPKVIQHAINEIFLVLKEDRPYSAQQLQDLIDTVDLVIPDTEDFSDIACSQALDAGVAVLSTLEYIKARELESVVVPFRFTLLRVSKYLKLPILSCLSRVLCFERYWIQII